MTAAAIQGETFSVFAKPDPERPTRCWHVAAGNQHFGVIELSPAGNFYAFVPGGQPEKCLGLFKDIVEAGQAIMLHHGFEVD